MIPLFKVFMADGVTRELEKVLHSGHIAQGPQVEHFEVELRKHLNAAWDVLTVNSGTAALELALHLIGFEPGDEVISTPMTCAATNGAILRSGATICWADVDAKTGLLDPKSVGKVVSSRTKAIMAVDWGGASCDYHALRAFNLPIVEDAAHAFVPRPAFSLGGDYVCWSFQAIKHLTTGDGGLLLVPPTQVERARKLRWIGLDRRAPGSFRSDQRIEEVGFKMHMNDIAATIGLANLPHVSTLVQMHRANAVYYHREFSCLDEIFCPNLDPTSSWWLYTILVKDRPRFEARMREEGIETSCVHSRNDRHPGFDKAVGGPLPGVDFFSKHAVAIPVGWWVTEEQREFIARTVRILDGEI